MSDQELVTEYTDHVQEASAETIEQHVDDRSVPDVVDDDEAVRNDMTARPTDVPEKFWDAASGTLRTDALLKSYLQLERKLGSMVPAPTDEDPESREKLHRILGRPDSPDDYQIESPDELITPDPEINKKLHEAGFTSEQAQLVYDLAAKHLLPVIEKVTDEASQSQELARLAAHFGGEKNWQSLAPQIRTWGRANLQEDVYETLGSSFDGIVAMHQMMQAREPSVISEAAVSTNGTDEETLAQMMRDPRYWRDRDPAFVGRVTEGYKQLYG